MTKLFNCSTIQRVKAYAFTLAETLIVIGIIGVVAALTLPNLNHATGDKEKVTKVKKIFSALTEAVDRAQAVYGDFDTWFNDVSPESKEANERFAKRITEFMKISKDCGFDEGCVSSAPVLLPNGTTFMDTLPAMKSQNAYMLTTPDGMSLAFFYTNMDGFMSIHQIDVDIDGPNKGKNQVGNDLFYFWIFTTESFNNYHSSTGATSTNQLYPYVKPMTGTFSLLSNDTWSTAAWVIENGNLDYLKLDSEGNCPDGEPLNWETKTSCK